MRRVWIAVMVVLVVLVAGVVVLDGFVRSYAAKQVANTLRSELGLPERTPLQATVGGFFVLGQLAVGKLDEVRVSGQNVTLGPVTGSFRALARGVPTSQGRPVDAVTADFRVDEQNLNTLVGQFARVPADAMTIADGAVGIRSELRILGAALPVAIELAPSAKDNKLVLTPTQVTIAGQSVTAAQAKARFGRLADVLFQSRSFCIAGALPKAVTLRDVRVNAQTVELSFAAADLPLDAAALATKGDCATH